MATRARLACAATISIAIVALAGNVYPASASPAPATDVISPTGTLEDEPRRGLLPDPTHITGTVDVRGCTPTASDLDVRATPISVGTADSELVPLDPRQTQLRAQIRPTANPHAHVFSIVGVRPALPYRISIFLPPSPICPRVFWRSSSNGLAVGGGPSVDIEGVAVTTRLEVQSAGTGAWVGADELDSTDPAAGTRTFRWSSTVPGIVRGELQVSTRRFPTDGAFGACDEPDGGVVYRQQLPAVQTDGGWSPVEVDLSRALSRDRVGSTASRLLEIGVPVYVRVVPQTAEGPVCDAAENGVPGWTVLGKVQATPPAQLPPEQPPVLEPGDHHVYAPPYVNRRPTYVERGYRVIEAHTLPLANDCTRPSSSSFTSPALTDPLGCALVLYHRGPGGTTLQPGYTFFFAASFGSGGGSDIISDFGSSLGLLATGVYEVAGLTVTTMAEAYNGVIAGVEQLAYDILVEIPGVGEFCSDHPDECKAAIKTGMTVALTAMGLPPSLPNWDELRQEGIDYLAAELGEQIEAETHIPSEITEEALKRLAQAAVDELTADRGGSDPRYDWVVPYNGLEPASWVVEVKQNTTNRLPANLVLVRRKTDLYLGASVPLPREFPDSRRLRIPMVLWPNLAGINAPVCQASFYTDPKAQCFGILAPTAEPICRFQSTANFDGTWQDDPKCSRYGGLVAIYYRDAWAAQKLERADCTVLIGNSYTNVDGLLLEHPDYSFSVIGLLVPTIGTSWNGSFMRVCG